MVGGGLVALHLTGASLINPLIRGHGREEPGKLLRSALVIAIQTGVLLARIGIVANTGSPLGHTRTMIAHWLSALLAFVFWAAFSIAVLDRFTDVTGRSAEYGILRILGASYGYFLRLVLQETLLAAVPGVLAGVVFAGLLSVTFGFASNGLVTINLPYLWWPAAGCLSSTASLLGAAFAIPKAVKEGIAQAL
jgi:predicted lysophospholipase L1 biosynthesis ABC-type transport system permease subunit